MNTFASIVRCFATVMNKGRVGCATVGVLVVTSEEWSAASRVFSGLSRIAGAYHSFGPVVDACHPVVLLKLSGRGTTPAFEGASDLMEDFRPTYLFLFGTAGGLSRDGVKLGDIVVADHIEFSSFKKIVSQRKSWCSRTSVQYRYRPTPFDHPSLLLRHDHAECLAQDLSWTSTIRAERPNARSLKVHIGQILSGDVIMSAPGAEEQRAAAEHFDKSLAVETEAVGLARACFRQRKDPTYNPLYLVVRGISDMIDGKAAESERKQWTEYAAEAAGRLVSKIVTDLVRLEQR